MSQEIELKLRLSPRKAAALARHPLLRDLPVRERRLLNTYYDTPDLQLRDRLVALRFRRSGDQWLLTVKGGQPSTGGLAARAEWEQPARPGEFEFSHVDDAKLRKLLEASRERLAPVFRTDFTRSAWQLDYRGTAIEVALDRGFVEADGKRAPLCELELELLASSDPAPLFALALELANDLPLHPEPVSKAERGYALFRDEPAPPAVAGKSPVVDSMSPVGAFCAIAQDCLGHLQRNEPGLLTEQDPEYLHQSRIATRRLRSALRFFAPELPAEYLATYRAAWREVARALGATRDWDVFLAQTLTALPPALQGSTHWKKLQAVARSNQGVALEGTRATLQQPSYGRFLLHFMADTLALVSPAHRKPPELQRLAVNRLRARWEKMHRRVAALDIGNASSLHAVRIRMKNLRYAVELLAPVLPKKFASRLQRSACHLQNLLGELNDLATARRLVKTHAPRWHDVDDWLANKYQESLASTNRALRRFSKAARHQ